MSIKAGNLRDQLQFERNTAETLPNGEPAAADWETIHTAVWAEVRPATANEVLKGQDLGHVVTHRIRIRYLPEITPDLRIRFDQDAYPEDARVFEIANVIDVENRHTELLLYAKETT